MTPAEQLRAAKALIDAPEKWLKRLPATDANGKAVGYEKPEAACFCSWGAVMAIDAKEAGPSSRDSALYHLDEALEGRFRKYSFISFNDHADTTHADVMALFDRAIALAESEQ